MKTYRGERTAKGVHVVVSASGERADEKPLPERRDIKDHCRDKGLDWGSARGGPSQLALAILAEHYGLNLKPPVSDLRTAGAAVESMYQWFRFRMVAALPYNGWKLTEAEIEGALVAFRRKEW